MPIVTKKADLPRLIILKNRQPVNSMVLRRTVLEICHTYYLEGKHRNIHVPWWAHIFRSFDMVGVDRGLYAHHNVSPYIQTHTDKSMCQSNSHRSL